MASKSNFRSVSRPAIQTTPATLAALLFLAAPISYFTLERFVAQQYIPHYSYTGQHTSDLGIAYSYTYPSTKIPVLSTKADVMNLNFVLNGSLYFLAHLCLFRAISTRISPAMSWTRTLIALIFAVGISMVAWVAGGPAEHADGSIVWHSIGAIMCIVGGNINSLLASLTGGLPAGYRWSCLLTATVGFSGIAGYMLAATDSSKGLFQRMSIYPTQTFDFLTAVALIVELSRGTASVKAD